MNISPAKPSDLDAVTSAVQACIRHMESQGIFQWDEIYPTRDVFQQDLAEQSLFVVRDGDAVVGAIVLNEHQEPEYGDVAWACSTDSVLVVHRLFVHPYSQGKGVAGRLMDYAEQYAQSRGYEAIRLDAFTKNPAAVSLYERRGYRNAGTVTFRKGDFYCFEKQVGKMGDSNGALLDVAANCTQER